MTTKELCEIFGVSRAMLMNYRQGYTHGKTVNGKRYEYHTPAILEEGVDFTWEKGNVIYTKSAVKKIKAFREGK